MVCKGNFMIPDSSSVPIPDSQFPIPYAKVIHNWNFIVFSLLRHSRISNCEFWSEMHISDDIVNWVILPVLIFAARLCDVTLATLRNIFISRGFRQLVPFVGFFEVLIWLIAMKQVMSRADNVACYLAWATGFATGTYVGMRIEERLALGMQVIRIITNQNSDNLIDALRAAHHGITIVDAQGAKGPVKMIFSIVQRKNLKHVVELIETLQPQAFYSIEDVRNAHLGVFRQGEKKMSLVRMLFPIRKGN